MNTNIHVNVNEIPPEVAERIGCVFLGFHNSSRIPNSWLS